MILWRVSVSSSHLLLHRFLLFSLIWQIANVGVHSCIISTKACSTFNFKRTFVFCSSVALNLYDIIFLLTTILFYGSIVAWLFSNYPSPAIPSSPLPTFHLLDYPSISAKLEYRTSSTILNAQSLMPVDKLQFLLDYVCQMTNSNKKIFPLSTIPMVMMTRWTVPNFAS